MRFALVVPALNEEEAIATTLRRALAARRLVTQQTEVDEMTVVFVNDGSTDSTQQIVDQGEFDEVLKIHFKQNRGYGAAIKAGWQATDADLVGFIDADGTCDPQFCIPLLRRLEETNADVVLAARLNPESKMPLVRKVGNVLFARLLGLVSGHRLTDTASGFRVIRRSSLPLLSPLPDGLHFTPAMSCMCLLDPRLGIEEVPMPYEERLGRSKLSVIKDGLIFLYTILFTACCYAPVKTMLGAALIVLLVAGLMGWIVAAAGGSSALLFGAIATSLIAVQMVATGAICHQLVFLLIGPRRNAGTSEAVLQQALHYKWLIGGGLAATMTGTIGLVMLGLWSGGVHGFAMALLVAMMMLTVLGVTGMLAGVVLRVIWAVGEKQKSLIRDDYPIRTPQQLSQVPTEEPGIAQTLESATDRGSQHREFVAPAHAARS